MANTDANVNAITVAQAGRLFYSERIISTGFVYPNAVAPALEVMNYAKTYDSGTSSRRLTSPSVGVVELPGILQPGTVTDFYIFGERGSGTITFNIRKNGVVMYSGGTRPVLDASSPVGVDSGRQYSQKTGVDEPTIFGDVFSLDIEIVTGTGIYPRITFVAVVQPAA